MRFWIGLRNALIPSLLLWALIIWGCSAAFAGGECNGHDNCNETDIGVTASIEGDQIDTNISTGGNRTVALGNSLGDVDISDCLGSTQWNTPVYGRQKLVLNQVCMAEFYLRTQKYELAAMALCNVPEIAREFETESECEAAHDFAPPTVTEASPEPHVPQDEFYRLEQMSAEQYDALVERIESIEKRPAPRPRPTTTVVQQPLLNDDAKAALADLINDDKDEDQ